MSRAIQISEVILNKISGRFAQAHVGMLRTKVGVLEVVVWRRLLPSDICDPLSFRSSLISHHFDIRVLKLLLLSFIIKEVNSVIVVNWIRTIANN